MWPDDPTLRSAALALYGAVWEHVPAGIEQARAWGGDWFEVSTPFLVRDGDRVLAHAGVIVCDLAVAGRNDRIFAVHGVCVHPKHQGKGLGRRVLEDALAHADRSGADTTILWSEKVNLYRKFDFEPVPESVFVADAPEGRTTRAFRLDLDDPRHLDLLRRALRRRRPVSELAAAADDGWHFAIDLALWPEARNLLIGLPEHDDAVAVCEVEGSLLRIYDVLAPRMPPCAALVGAARSLSGRRIHRLEIYFTPDLLDVTAEPMPHTSEDVLMVRGKPLVEPPAPVFALSPFTRT